MLVYGDSLSAAYGLRERQGWVALLAERLKREHPDYSVANASISGETTAGGLARLPQVLERAQKAGARVLVVGMRLPPNYGPDYAGAFERAFAEVAKSRKAALLPFLLEGFAEKEELFQADRIHPAAKAQALVLNNVWRALAPLLR